MHDTTTGCNARDMRGAGNSGAGRDSAANAAHDSAADAARDSADARAFAEALEGRTRTYDFISRLFRVEVDDALLEELLAMEYPTAAENEDIACGYELMRAYLADTDENTLTDLAIDYVRTFIGSGSDGFSAAYPFESVYTSPKRLLMQDARDEVLVLYRSAGLEKKESWKEGEDHIALELEYLSVLGNRAIRAYEDGDEERCAELLLQQRNFIEDHLAPWFPMMAQDMLKFAKTGLYQGLARLTSGVIEQDLAFLNEAVEDAGAQPADGADGEGGKVVHMEVDLTPRKPDTPTEQDVQDALAAAEAAKEAARGADAADAEDVDGAKAAGGASDADAAGAADAEGTGVPAADAAHPNEAAA